MPGRCRQRVLINGEEGDTKSRAGRRVVGLPAPIVQLCEHKERQERDRARQCYYGWLRRYPADGLDGLRDRSSRPHTSPRATQAEVVEKILWLRQQYHFGPAKIAMYLARYHDVTISTSGGVADPEAARR